MKREVYVTSKGHLRLPFAHLTQFVTANQVRLHANEIRAVLNMHQFLRSLSIICYRIRGNLMKFAPETWVDVHFDELFLDTQSFFLFVQQFLEDVTLVVRLSSDPSMRSQMSPKFSALLRRLPKLLPEGHPLRLYLNQEMKFFDELKDLRDDILHRTGFGRVRSAEFPEFRDFIRAAGGKAPFASGQDLRAYISDCTKKIMAVACLADDLVRDNLLLLVPSETNAYQRFPLSYIMPMGALELEVDDPEPRFEVGMVMMTFHPQLYESLMFFLEGREESHATT